MAAKVPVRVGDVDIYVLPLSPLEAFVLFRVDGSATMEEIAVMTSTRGSKLDTIVDRLEELGAVKQPWKSAIRRVAVKPVTVPAGSAPGRLYDDPTMRPRGYKLAELQHDADIDTEARRRILNAFYRVDEYNLYGVLGLSQSAGKKEIRTSYFALSKRFHPDAFFGRYLGVYQSRLEHVFERLTEAYETLSRKKRRTKYDAYLVCRGVSDDDHNGDSRGQRPARSGHNSDAAGVGNTPSSEVLRHWRRPKFAATQMLREVQPPTPSSHPYGRHLEAAGSSTHLVPTSPHPASLHPRAARSRSSVP